MGLIIQAILLFYLRIFPNKWMKYAVYGLSALIITWTIVISLVVVVQCNPVQYFWNRSIPGGKCINNDAYYFATGLSSTIIMITVLALPLPLIWKLQVSLSRRLGLAVIFLMGALSVHPSTSRQTPADNSIV